jgi:predicted negative regulator of RcsB-dependent stress response
MKTGRRHELQTNQLADQLGRWLQKVQPHLKWIGFAVIVGLAALVVVTFVSQRQQSALASAWQDYLVALDTPDADLLLQDLANAKPGTSAGLWARLSRADIDLGRGSEAIFRDREEAERLLADAKEGMEYVIEHGRAYPLLVQRGWYGLGQTLETLGDLKGARGAYEEAKQTMDTSAIAQLAQERLDTLQNKDVAEFYDWFVKQEITPSTTSSADLPADLLDLPDFPDLTIPEVMPPDGGIPSGDDDLPLFPGSDDDLPTEPPGGEPSTDIEGELDKSIPPDLPQNSETSDEQPPAAPDTSTSPPPEAPAQP